MIRFMFYSVLFLFGLGFVLLRETSEEPYTLGVWNESSIGNRKVGHVKISHIVTKEKAGGYLYRFTIVSRSRYELRFTLDQDHFDLSKRRIQPTQYHNSIEVLEEPPVWKMMMLTLEVRTTNGGWQKVGTWHQHGPAPSSRGK